MTPLKIRLLCIVFFTLLFMALVVLGSYLLSVGSKQYAVAAFLFAFAAIFGQLASLALYLRLKARIQYQNTQTPPHQGNPHV